MSFIQTDRHKRHTSQLAWMPLLCPLECPPTPITRIARLSSLAAKLGSFCYHLLEIDEETGGYTVWYILPALHYTIYSSVRDPKTQPLSRRLSVTGLRRIRYDFTSHRSLGGKKKSESYIRVRKVDSLLFSLESPELQPVYLSGHTSWHNDLIHLCKVLLENRNDSSGEIEYCNISLVLELPVSICLLVSMLQLMMTYESLT